MALKVYTQWELLLRIDLELNVSVECFSRVPIIHFVKLITLFKMINWKILKKYVIFCVWFSSKLDIGIITLNYFVMPQRAQHLVRRRKWNMSSSYVVTTSWYGNFVGRHSFCIVSDNSPELCEITVFLVVHVLRFLVDLWFKLIPIEYFIKFGHWRISLGIRELEKQLLTFSLSKENID